MADDETAETPPEDAPAEATPPTNEELVEAARLARLERDRLKARLLGREALLRAAARRLRRFDPADPVAASIDRELGDGLPD